jgi:hypothetical protein
VTGTKNAVIIPNQLEIVLICAAVARVETEASDFLKPRSPQAVIPMSWGRAYHYERGRTIGL